MEGHISFQQGTKKAKTLRGWSGKRNPLLEPPSEPKRHSKKKDTKRWCLGKVGREHKLEWTRDARTDYGFMFGRGKTPDNEAWWTLICTTCKKHLDYCWKWSSREACKCGNHK